MDEQLTEILENAHEIKVYKNTELTPITQEQVLPQLTEMLDKAYFAPAFAVVRPQDFEKMFKKGLWVEFCFNRTRTFAEMPFEKLIINIKPDLLGFNVMRYNNGVYDGRCFYLNLTNYTTAFYKHLNELLK